MTKFLQLSAAEAVEQISNGQTIAVGGFTPAGSVKEVTRALAEKARQEEAAGREFRIRLISGASTDDGVDGALANHISFRVPYQTNRSLRQQINEGRVEFLDMHLSSFLDQLKRGIFGEIDYAILEAADVKPDGSILLTTGVGIAPTITRLAKKIIIEVNRFHQVGLEGLHDIYQVELPPNSREIPIYKSSDRIGQPFLKVDPRKIVAIVSTDQPDSANPLTPVDETTAKIGENVAEFLLHEWKKGRIPPNFSPLQLGVGSVANALMTKLLDNPQMIPFLMYSEILPDSVIDGIEQGRILSASGSALGISPDCLKKVYSNLPFFLKHLLLRPQEITNSPEIIRRLGLIGINTALEVDLWGNVNSTHVAGRNLINGIGGSGDFTRNCAISIFTTASTAKNGAISCFVPYCSHIDHSEHDTQIIVSERGVADLRGHGPAQRAKIILEKCVHPDFQPILADFFKICQRNRGHMPLDLPNCFAFHLASDQRSVRWE